MLKSMTGFARGEAQHADGALTLEVKSVNHRYLEVAMRLPEEFRPLEPAVRARVAAKLARGKVDVGLKFLGTPNAADEFVVDETLVARLARSAGRIATAWGKPSVEPTTLDLMRWPGVLNDAPRDDAPLHAAALALLDETLDTLIESREREGERIAQMLEARCAGVLEQVAQVRARVGEVNAALLTKMRERIAALDVDADEGRLEQEAAILAQKADVAEELDRLESHVREARAALAAGEPVGRRLDFLMQEFNREANTLASKSQDSAFSKAAVDLKVLIEQMREQVQNVE